MKIFHFSFDQNAHWLDKKKLLNFLSTSEQERVCRLYQDHHKVAKLYSLLFQRYILSKTLNIPHANIVYSIGKQGKPYLENIPIYFNLSNSKNTIVMAIDTYEIGVDIEENKAIDLEIAKRFFSSEENLDILNHLNPSTRFFEYWTLKEAFLKCIGTGLSKPLSSFTVNQQGESHYIVTEQEKNYYLFQTYLNFTLPIAICSPNPIENIHIKVINSEIIENFFNLK